MGKLLDGRVRVYSTGAYIDIDVVVDGQWEGYCSVCLATRAETVAFVKRNAKRISEAVLGKGNARVDIEGTL